MLWAPWNLSGPALAEGQRDAVLVALKEQEAAGIDIVTDGEQSRQHFVHGFLEAIDGIDFGRRVTIGIRADRYKAEVPTVTGPLGAGAPCTPTKSRFARAHTTKQAEVHDPRADDDRGHARRRALPRPAPPGDGVRARHQRGGARAWRRGLDVLQLDEPAFNVYMDDVSAWGIEALHRAIEGLACKTAVHICYGYGIKANIDWKATLGRSGGSTRQTFPLLAASRIDQMSLECANSRVPV